MKHDHRVLSFLAGILAILLLAGCQNSGGHTNTTKDASETPAMTETGAGQGETTDEGQVPITDGMVLLADGQSRYTIIRSDLDTDEAKLAVSLRNRIRDTVGVRMNLKTDFDPEDMTEYEIVIGKTERENTLHTFAVMGYKDFTIVQDGSRIYIRGGDYEGTAAGVEYFISHYVFTDDKTVTVPRDVNILKRGDYPVKELTICGNSLEKYRIVYGADAGVTSSNAAAELQKYLSFAAGYPLDVVKDSEEPTEYEILVGKTNRAGCYDTLPEDLGEEGVSIRTVGNRLVLSGGKEQVRGTLYSVYEFLDRYVGMRFYTQDTEACIDAEKVEIAADLSYSYVPGIRYRAPIWKGVLNNNELSAKHFISGDWGVSSTPKYPVTDTYTGLSAHTFAQLAGVAETTQPCLTNEVVYEKVLKNVLAEIASNPDAYMISVSQNDNYDYCTCSGCTARVKTLGNQTDLLIDFVNRIAAEVKKQYPDMKVHTFAYQYTNEPPKTVVPADNVVIQLCSIDSCMYDAYDDTSCDANAVFCEQLKKWSEISSELWIWDYTTNFWATISPFSNLGVLRRNIALFAKYNVKGIYSQGQILSGEQEFGELRSYLISSVMWHPDMTEEEYIERMNGFLRACYGEGWESIRAYIDKLAEINGSKHIGCHVQQLGAVNTAGYKENSAYFNELWDRAEALAGDCLPRVQLARLAHTFTDLSVNYKELYFNGDEASRAAYTEEITAFYNALVAGNIYMMTGNTIQNIAADVDLTQSPASWIRIK